MSECKFCDALEDWKDAYKRNGSSRVYSVAIVIRSPGRVGRTTDFRRQGLGYALNYCPECGRPLTRRAKGEAVK